MPKDLVELVRITGGTATFGSGTPFNDLEYTVFDTDYMEGETDGFDIFQPVDPSEPAPGADTVKIVQGVNNLDLDSAYSGPDGDRIILGDVNGPYFLRGANGVDDDYASVVNFDYTSGFIELAGTAADYELLFCATSDGCASEGYYLFDVRGDAPDLVAFVFPCDDLALPISGNPPADPDFLCNATKALSLSDDSQFRFAAPLPPDPSVPGATAQLGTEGKEVVGGVAMDAAGNMYAFGLTDGGIGGGPSVENQVFVAQVGPDGTRGWTYTLELPNGSLLFDAVADDTHLYAVGRTLGALPGFENAGRWDAVILKLDLADGSLAASDQWGNPGLDGYGNVTLDDAGHLYLSGAGSPEGAADTDAEYLLAKHRASDLANVWRRIVPPEAPSRIFVSEAWGGIHYRPGPAPGAGEVSVAGWYMAPGGSDAFIEIWGDVDTPAPTRRAAVQVSSPGQEADWVYDHVRDADGSLYAAGYTTGSLGAPQSGEGDAFLRKYGPDLSEIATVQVGSPRNDSFRKVDLTPDGVIVASGFTYGGLDGPNADASGTSGDALAMSFDRDLSELARTQFGTPGEDRAFLATSGETALLGGMTEGALAAPGAGSFDAYLRRLSADTLQPE